VFGVPFRVLTGSDAFFDLDFDLEPNKTVSLVLLAIQQFPFPALLQKEAAKRRARRRCAALIL
jgi:hypothetical protein